MHYWNYPIGTDPQRNFFMSIGLRYNAVKMHIFEYTYMYMYVFNVFTQINYTVLPTTKFMPPL